MIFALFWHNVHINDTRNYVVNRKGVGISGSEKYCRTHIDGDILVQLFWASNLLPSLFFLFLVAFLCYFCVAFLCYFFGNINFPSNIDRRLTYLWVPAPRWAGEG